MTSADYKEFGGNDQEKGISAGVDVLMNFRKFAPPFGTKPPPPPPEKKEPEKK